MITDVENCSAEELQNQIAYLANTAVRGIAELLRNGQCTLKKGIVRSLSWLGNLKTEFGQIGPLIPSATEGEKKFRVSEIVPLLRANPVVDDGGLLKAIEAFIEKDTLGEVEYNVTIFNFGNDLVMKDGDKRTVAFYEHRKETSNNSIEFPVFIVQPAGMAPNISFKLTTAR